jgi:hypothetical protein
MSRIDVITVLCIVLASCGTSKIDGAADRELEFAALGRYATSTNAFLDFSVYKRAMVDGSFEYDDVVRHPHIPAGPTEISCSETHRIGALIYIVGYSSPASESSRPRGKIHAGRVTLKYAWTHSATDMTAGRYETRARSQGYGIISDGLTLTKRDRVNGVITLSVTHVGEAVYTTSFKLNDCESDT